MSPREEALARIKTMTPDEWWALEHTERFAMLMRMGLDDGIEWLRYVQGLAASYIPLEPEPTKGRIRMTRDLPPPRAVAGEGT